MRFSRTQVRGHGPRQLLVVVLITLALALASTTTAGAIGPSCNTTSFGSYTVKVCLTVGGSATTLTGDATVSATVTITGSSPGIRKLEFEQDGAYLLTDFESPYTFTLPTATFVDGTHTHRLDVFLRDGNTAFSPVLSVTFNNGVTSPPPQPTGFQPTSGRPAAPGEPFIVAATGDGASGQSTSDSVVSLIDSWNPNLFLYTGDVYEKGTPTEFYNWYGVEGQRYGKFKSITNPIVGNHEYEGGSAPGYFGYWSGVPDYYSYDAGGWHFVALNSNSQLNGFNPGTPQYEWLKDDLAAHPGGCTMAYFHHPVLSVGPQGSTAAMLPIWKLMVDNGVDMVVTGHDHQYQRTQPLDRDLKVSPTGVTHFVAGGGGHGVQATVRTDSRVAAIADTTANGFGALKLKLAGGSAQYSYVNPGGAVQDSGTVQCSGVSADTTPPSVPQNVTATATTSPDVTVAWSASTDNQGIASYEVKRGADVVATIPAGTTSWVDTQTAPNTSYTYAVRAVDLSGNTSGWSAGAQVTTPDAQTMFTWKTVADAYVDATSPSANFGSRTDLRLDSSPTQVTYLRFNVTGIGSRAPENLVLRVRAASGLKAGFEVRTTGSGWTESGITHNNAPPPGALLGTSGPVTAGTWVEVPVPGLVSGDGTYEVALAPLSSTALRLDARETGNPAELDGDITGSGSNAAPVSGNVAVTTDEDTPTSWTPDVHDADNDPLTCSIDAAPATGTATVAANCSSGSFTPAANANGPVTFSYRVSDGKLSSTGQVSVQVAPVNDAPVAATVSGSGWPAAPVELTLAAHDVDGDCPMSFAVATPPGHGTLSSIGTPQCSGGDATAKVTYTSQADWTGSDSFTYTVTDAGGLSSTALASVNVQSSPAQFTLTPAADAFVDETKPTTNYGSRVDLRLDASPVQQTSLRFDVVGLGSQPPASAVLRIYALSSLAAGFEVHTSSGPWTESGLTWNNRPTTGALVGTSGPVATDTWVEVPLTGVVTGDGSYDFVLTPLSNTALRLDSRESMKPAELKITR